MEYQNFALLSPTVVKKIVPMVEDMLREHESNIHSVHIVGSAVISDYNEKLSDINSVVVLHSMDLKFIEFLAPLGTKYGKKGISAPLVLTDKYIHESLDTFPVEFHDFKLIHKTVHGPDIFSELNIEKSHLRHQCEREIKSKLIGLRQGYVSSLGKKGSLTTVLISSFTGSMPLLRAIIALLGKEPPIPRAEVITMIAKATNIDNTVFQDMLSLKTLNFKPSEQELRLLFERYYSALESTGKIIDELHS